MTADRIARDLGDERGVFPCRHHSTMLLHANIYPRGEKYARWWLQFIKVFSPHRHDHDHHYYYHFFRPKLCLYQIFKIREKILHICFVESSYSVYAVGFWLVKANVWIWQEKSVEPVLFGCFLIWI
jgi:hypothetical protein